MQSELRTLKFPRFPIRFPCPRNGWEDSSVFLIALHPGIIMTGRGAATDMTFNRLVTSLVTSPSLDNRHHVRSRLLHPKPPPLAKRETQPGMYQVARDPSFSYGFHYYTGIRGEYTLIDPHQSLNEHGNKT